MSQSTKLVLILLFLFIIYTTAKGTFGSYLGIMLGKTPATLGNMSQRNISIRGLDVSNIKVPGMKEISDHVRGIFGGK